MLERVNPRTYVEVRRWFIDGITNGSDFVGGFLWFIIGEGGSNDQELENCRSGFENEGVLYSHYLLIKKHIFKQYYRYII